MFEIDNFFKNALYNTDLNIFLFHFSKSEPAFY